MSNKLNILIAYPYMKQKMVDFLLSVPRDSYRLIIDSGAFSVWNSGKVIFMKDYCDFLNSIKSLSPFNAVQLDVFADPVKSWENFIIMKNLGHDVMPVFTRGENLEMLEKMYSYTDYIMFGGIVTGSKNKNYVKWFMGNNKKRKVHWLGFTDIDFIKYYRPESVDSSSWLSAARYGNIGLYEGHGKLKSVNKQEFKKVITGQNKVLLRGLGLNEAEICFLNSPTSWVDSGSSDLESFSSRPSKTFAKFVNTLSHVKRAIDIEKNLTTKVYLAVANLHQLELVYAALKFLNQRKVI